MSYLLAARDSPLYDPDGFDQEALEAEDRENQNTPEGRDVEADLEDQDRFQQALDYNPFFSASPPPADLAPYQALIAEHEHEVSNDFADQDDADDFNRQLEREDQESFFRTHGTLFSTPSTYPATVIASELVRQTPPAMPLKTPATVDTVQQLSPDELSALKRKLEAMQSVPPPKPVSEPTDVKPYHAAQEFIAAAHLARVGSLFYTYSGGAYLTKSIAELKENIMGFCRSAVESTGTAGFVRQVYELLTVEPSIRREESAMLNAIAFQDGVLLLDGGEFVPHSPGLFVTTKLKASFAIGSNTDCPIFKQFMNTVTGGDPVLEQRIWEAIAYLLVPDQAGKVMVVCQGVSNSGKSVLGNFLKDCFVGDVVSALDINAMSGNFTLADLIGKKFCMDLDLPADTLNKRAVSVIKKLTGSDEISSDIKFKDRARFHCLAKFLFCSNHPLLLANTDEAFLNRLVVIPFRYSIPKARQNFHLREQLDQERDAIIYQALQYYPHLVSRSYQFAGNFPLNEVCGNDEASLSDAVASFISEDCMLNPEAWTSTGNLYSAFTDIYGEACTLKDFSKILLQLCKSRALDVEKGRHRLTPNANPVQGFTGISLK